MIKTLEYGRLDVGGHRGVHVYLHYDSRFKCMIHPDDKEATVSSYSKQ